MSSAAPHPFRLAVVETNPVQYRVPLWRAIAASGRFDLEVFYATKAGLAGAKVDGIGEAWTWDIPLLGGYTHRFLASRRVPCLKGSTESHYPLGLYEIFRQSPFDAMLVTGYTSMASWAGMLAAWRTGIPVLMRGDTHGRGRSQSTRLRVKRLLLPILLRRVSGFLAIGSWNREYWESYGVPENKIVTTIYSVDNASFASMRDERQRQAAALRLEWGVPSDGTVFLFCARLSSEKAPEMLLRALALLADPSAHLVFVGSGPAEPSLKELEEGLGLQHVHWAGFVNQSNLPAYYRAADVMVLPSRFEPWGLVVNEAMACGTPCIVSDVVGAGADLVAGQDTGLIFARDDVPALAAALRTALNPELRERWKSNLPRVLAQVNFEKNVQALETVLGRVVHDPGRDGAAGTVGRKV